MKYVAWSLPCSQITLLPWFKVHVEFSDGGDVIKIEGPPDESEKARVALEAQAQELIRTMDHAEISVDAKYHKHIIGKGGSTGNNLVFIYFY